MRDGLTVHVRFRDEAELCGYCWDIRNPSGTVVANSWESEWMVYESSSEALAAGLERLEREERPGV